MSAVLRVPRHVNDHSFALDQFSRHRAKKTTVVAVIPIVTHHKKMACGNFVRTEIIAVASSCWHRILFHVFGPGRIFKRATIDVENFVDNLHLLSTDGDAALDQITVDVDGRAKNDDIAGLGVAESGEAKQTQTGSNNINRSAEDKFIGK